MDLVNEKCVLATFGKIGNTSKNPPPSSSSCAREEGGETVEVDETRLTMKEQPANGTLFFVRSKGNMHWEIKRDLDTTAIILGEFISPPFGRGGEKSENF